MKTEIDYKKGVLFIRIDGFLISSRIHQFESEVIPIILGLSARFVTINLDRVELIDKTGIESLIKLSSIVNRFNGKLVISNINQLIIDNIKNSDLFDYCFKSINEKKSFGVFAI